LVFVPLKGSDIRFSTLTVGSGATAVTYTEAQQQTAFDAFIEQDSYLKTRRGQYVQRNGSLLPYLHRFDLSVMQDFFVKVKEHKNTLQLRVDILNFGNLVSNSWGVSQRATAPALLNFVSYNSLGEPTYRLATQKLTDGTTILARDTYQKNSSSFDVWSAQFGVRYIFGR
jgi:hypothetical protein